MSSTAFEIMEIEDDASLLKCYPILKQLRPHLDEATFVQEAQALRAVGLHFVSASHEGHVVGLATYRLLVSFAHGRNLYVDDLVTDQSKRSLGVGKGLIQWLTQRCRELACPTLQLDSGTQRERAHAFYFREGFFARSFHFVKPIDPSP